MTWAIASFAFGLLASFERGKPSPRAVALVAALAGLAVAGRLAFAPLPNVKPTTDIVLIAGFALGARSGFAVGAVTALVSNMAFGQGPWTPWQMFAWGLVGIVGAGCARLTDGRINRWGLAAIGAACGLLFGMIMDVSQWLTFGGEPTLSKLAAYAATSLPWNIAHAGGNAAFALAFGPILIAAVKRARTRLEPVWLPAGSALNGLGIAALLAVAGPFAGQASQPHQASAASTTPLAWLVSAQNADGGFGSDRGGSSAPMTTAWAALALAASGKRLDTTARAGGLTVMERLMADARITDEVGAQERLLLAAVAAGGDPRGFGGSDLVAAVRGKISARGFVKSDSGMPAVNLTAFAVLSLTGAGINAASGRLAASVSWLSRQQQADGGFGPYAKGVGGSDVDDTAAVLEALAAAGAESGQVVDKAVAYLATAKSSSGGYPMVRGQAPNAQSTAWAIQGLAAVGRPTASAVRWLRQRIAPDGRVAYAPGSIQTPVWVTSQSLLALSGSSLPLAPPAPLKGQGAAGESGGESAVKSVDSSSSKAPPVAAKPDPKRALEVRKGKAILHARAIALAAARTAGTLIGAFVRAFSGQSR